MDERLQGLGSNPVSEEAPTGENAKYDETYEQLSEELAKLESVSGDNTVDWSLVTDLSITILKSKSKDLLAAAYLAQSLLVKQGLTGLGDGLSVLADMLATYYDDLFPPLKRIKARANAISWLADKAEPKISAMNPTVKDYQQFQSCLEYLQAIQDVCDEKMGDQGPSLGGLKKAIKNWRDHLKPEWEKQQKSAEQTPPTAEADQTDVKSQAPAEESPTSESKPIPAKPAAQAVPSASPALSKVDNNLAVNDDKGVKNAIRSVQDVGKKIALYKRESNPADPAAYALLRSCVWMQIERLPPHEDNVTQLPELDPDRQNLLQNLHDSQAWPDLIKGAESAFCDAFFWLTAHRFTHAALQALGHEQAADALAFAVAGFIRRFPALRQLKFVSQAPFADEMTQVWLDQHVLASAETGTGASAGESWHQGLEDALALAGKGKTLEGIKLLKNGEREAHNDRHRFMWQMCSAQYLSKTGKVELAVPQLEYLWRKLEQANLFEWEATAAAVIAKELLNSYQSNQFKKDMNEWRNALIPELKSVLYRNDVEALLG